ncbi:BZ3500_MvSof-1268-A1-R1_Chr2-2g05084 [Microbotryum saponariae]|uniref:BZ3500_MvSof-1268-A1-R1_Chr2-2g05084 protein n=1 Tax=Microbotryum saponariae TaxID=289078 RepID=A0A2X0K8P4_9BASI|nr:BZ3500_MvSof-1268-A1-R1_Chr2-2g05084 [Microbotryum saponariae]SDA00873.1 BZ3501_MvSof-1269-A2-R1_Chr2-2g04758 [Microbotryum saponariae]
MPAAGETPTVATPAAASISAAPPTPLAPSQWSTAASCSSPMSTIPIMMPLSEGSTHHYRPCSRESNSSCDSFSSSFDDYGVDAFSESGFGALGATTTTSFGFGGGAMASGAGASGAGTSAALEPCVNGSGFMVRTHLDDAHDFMIEVTWSELINLLVDPSISRNLGPAHLVSKIVTFVRGKFKSKELWFALKADLRLSTPNHTAELGHSDTSSSPFLYQARASGMQPSMHGDLSSINSVANDMELLAVRPHDIFPTNVGSTEDLNQSKEVLVNSLHPLTTSSSSYVAEGYGSGTDAGLESSSWSNQSKWRGPSNVYPGPAHPKQHDISNTGQYATSSHPYSAGPNELLELPTSRPGPSYLSNELQGMQLQPRSGPARPEPRSRHSSDAHSMQRAMYRDQGRPYSRSGSGLPTSLPPSGGHSIRSAKSDKGEHEGSPSHHDPRPLQPLNGRTELYVFDDLSQTVARVSHGAEALSPEAALIEFPPGSYHRVFHEDLEVLPSDIGHGRAVLWLRGQVCVAKCRFRLEGKRPAVIRAHFATCKLREGLSVDPLGRLCRLQVEARRWATERDRERLATSAASIRSLPDSSNCDSDDSRSVRSEYSVQSTGSSVTSFSASHPSTQPTVLGPVRPIRSRQHPDGRPLAIIAGAGSKDDGAYGSGDRPMVLDDDAAVGSEEGAYALASGGTANHGGHWTDQWLDQHASSDVMNGDALRTATLPRAGAHRSTRSMAQAAAAGTGGASFLSIE